MFSISVDLYKFVIALVCVIGAIFLQYTQGTIPTWLVIAVSSVIAFYMGYISNPPTGGSNNANPK